MRTKNDDVKILQVENNEDWIR